MDKPEENVNSAAQGFGTYSGPCLGRTVILIVVIMKEHLRCPSFSSRWNTRFTMGLINSLFTTQLTKKYLKTLLKRKDNQELALCSLGPADPSPKAIITIQIT